jgi:hypothetical protein
MTFTPLDGQPLTPGRKGSPLHDLGRASMRFKIVESPLDEPLDGFVCATRRCPVSLSNQTSQLYFLLASRLLCCNTCQAPTNRLLKPKPKPKPD